VWLSRDPFGEEGGLNIYGYAGNNSLNYSDPLGLAFGDYWDARVSSEFYRKVMDTTENPWAAAGASLALAIRISGGLKHCKAMPKNRDLPQVLAAGGERSCMEV
jgi:uncharacterized protein RhaS with RHS repeats